MRKTLFTMALCAMAMVAQAQVTVTNVMNGYKSGDKLEKNVYSDENRTFLGKTWSGAYYKDKLNPNPSPVVGDGLTYGGYPEKGPAIKFGGFPTKDKGSRVSVYSLKEKGGKGKGTIYFSFLVNFKKLGLPGMADLVGLHHHYLGSDLARANFYVGKVKDNAKKIRFGVSMLKLKAESAKQYDYNTTHLVVIKVDYAAQTVSMFVNPKLGGDEPEADATVNGTDGTKLTQGISSIVLRNRSNYEGSIGSFRMFGTWADITTDAQAQQ